MKAKRERKPTRADFERAKEILQKFQMEAATELPPDLSMILCQGASIAYQNLRSMISTYFLDTAIAKAQRKANKNGPTGLAGPSA
jgi:hypothetical protein